MARLSEGLAADLLDRVLMKLGFSDYPEATLDGLRRVYAAWCRRVPFDNVRKLIHLHANVPGPLPGDHAAEFFEAWLSHGTGGTCWAGNGALHALLVSLGLAAGRGIGSMLTSPDVPPNHGTVWVDVEGARYLVDASILHSEPLCLKEGAATRIEHPAWGVQCGQRDGRWHVRWRPLHIPTGIDCRIEHFLATRTEFEEFHERTRPWSPFNYALSARLICRDTVAGVAFGQAVTLERDGGVVQEHVGCEGRLRLLVDQLGMSEEIVSRLPPDRPTPPPPLSRTAPRAASV
ncbi:MAG: hypothetical protein GEU73_05705 [Chloroflexi bacterium]|nr:hypothetical protein [Chloroflexota bacterium]